MTTVPIFRPSRGALPDKYIIGLKDHADMESHLIWLQQQNLNYNDESSKCEVTHKYTLVKGYAAKLVGPILVDLTKRDDVKSIAQDQHMVIWSYGRE